MREYEVLSATIPCSMASFGRSATRALGHGRRRRHGTSIDLRGRSRRRGARCSPDAALPVAARRQDPHYHRRRRWLGRSRCGRPNAVAEEVRAGYLTPAQARALRRGHEPRRPRSTEKQRSRCEPTPGMTRLATDIGGTFTDLVDFDETTGDLHRQSADDAAATVARGVLDTIASAAAGSTPDASTSSSHGGTTVINAITERKGVRTALVTTAGFRDVLEIGRGNRPDLYNLQFHRHDRSCRGICASKSANASTPRGRPDALVDRRSRCGRAECIAEKVEAVAILFLHSYANPEHEAAVAALLRQRLPGVAVTREPRSLAAMARIRAHQYRCAERLCAADHRRYFANLEGALPRGHIWSALCHAIERRPAELRRGGGEPACAGRIRPGRRRRRRCPDRRRRSARSDVLYLDVGGTTAKCSLIRDGQPVLEVRVQARMDRLLPGYPVQVPVVDIVEIGAGGGSIAWIGTAGNSRRTGERRRRPGPACYGRGGAKPTVTDAKLLTGVIDPDNFAGGRMHLDRELARRPSSRSRQISARASTMRPRPSSASPRPT